VATEFEDLRGATGAVGQAIADIGATVRHAAGKINGALEAPDQEGHDRLLREAVADLEKLFNGINQMALDPDVDIPASDNGITTPPAADLVRPEEGNTVPNFERGIVQPGVMGYGRPREVPEANPVAQEEVAAEELPEGYIPPPPPPSYGSSY
jgi:hypothetical protein